MDTILIHGSTFATLDGQAEIVLVFALILILFGAKRLSELANGLQRGTDAFRTSTREIIDEMDQAGFDAGRNAGGIYGSPAAEALTPHNQTAELYDPAVFKEEKSFRRSLFSRIFEAIKASGSWVLRGLRSARI